MVVPLRQRRCSTCCGGAAAVAQAAGGDHTQELLQRPRAVSSLDELATGSFQRILPDTQIHSGAVRRVLIITARSTTSCWRAASARRHDVAIVRLEQLYPPGRGCRPAWRATPTARQSSGCRRSRRTRAPGATCACASPAPDRPASLSGIYRPASANTATGSASSHKMEQRQLIDRAFGDGSKKTESIPGVATTKARGEGDEGGRLRLRGLGGPPLV